MFSRTVLLVLVATLAGAILSGCNPSPPMGEATSGAGLPRWVRIAVPDRDGRSVFVGGVSFAENADAAVRAAEADAQSQLHLAAVERANNLFARGNAQSNIETTAMERLEFKRSLSNGYADHIVGSARRDSVYYRPCGEGSPAAGGSGQAVCQAFVQISVDDGEWDAMLARALADEKARWREEGQSNLAELADWLSRELGNEASQREPERR